MRKKVMSKKISSLTYVNQKQARIGLPGYSEYLPSVSHKDFVNIMNKKVIRISMNCRWSVKP